MAADDIDDYLASVDEPKRATLATLRSTIRSILPDAEECLSYGVPGFRVRGVVVAGFAAQQSHLSYFPHSGSVLSNLGDEVARYSCSKGALRFGVDVPLPRSLVERLIEVRLAELPPPVAD